MTVATTETPDIAANMRRKPAKQEGLPGIADSEIEEQARKVRDITSERVAMQDTESKEREKLLAMMDERGYTEDAPFKFEEDGVKYIARIKVGKRKVSVRTEASVDNDDDDGAD